MKYSAGLVFAFFAAAGFAAQNAIPEALDADDAASDRVAQLAARLTVGEFVDVAAEAERMITDIEATSTRYDIALAPPLVLLGDAKLGLGDGPGALQAYERALHVTRVVRGLFDAEQVDIVYREAVVHASMGDRRAANDRHEYAYNVLLRSYGSTDPKLIPGLFRLAEWYQSTYNIFTARGVYERAVFIAKQHFVPGDARTIAALRGLAETFRQERFPPYQGGDLEETIVTPQRYRQDPSRYRPMTINNFAPGERALIEIVNLKQSNPDVSEIEIAEAILELADWYLLFEKYNRAFPLYSRVWELLGTDQKRLDSTFKFPTPLYLPLPGDPRPPPASIRGESMDGIVELAVTVTNRGLVGGVDTVRSEPEGMMDFKVRKATRRARYRPAFTESEPVRTEDLRLEYKFVYFPKKSTQTR